MIQEEKNVCQAFQAAAEALEQLASALSEMASKAVEATSESAESLQSALASIYAAVGIEESKHTACPRKNDSRRALAARGHNPARYIPKYNPMYGTLVIRQTRFYRRG